MKKLSYILLLIVLCFGMCIGFTACGDNEDTPPPATTYTITFKQDGVEDVVKKIEEGKDFPSSQIPVIQNNKPGYTLTWENVDLTKVSKDITVNAVATPITYVITINNNDGQGVPAVNVEFGKEYDIPNPVREGYDFIGWTLDGNVFASKGTWSITSDVVIKANWQAKSYVVTFKGVTLADFSQNWALYEKLSEADGIVQLSIASDVIFADPTNFFQRAGKTFISFVNDEGKVIKLGTNSSGKTYILNDQTVSVAFADNQDGKQIIAFLEGDYVPVIKYVDNGGTFTEIPAIQEEISSGFEKKWDITEFVNVTETIRTFAFKTEKTFRVYYDLDEKQITKDNQNKFKLTYDEVEKMYYQEVKYLASYELLDSIYDAMYKLVGWKDANTEEEVVSSDRFIYVEDIYLYAETEIKTTDDMTNDDNWSEFQ